MPISVLLRRIFAPCARKRDRSAFSFLFRYIVTTPRVTSTLYKFIHILRGHATCM